jgi:N-acetylglucosaminyldiphosphoundecaprenol N-acetyl-beta-D-mannosaminyltransferase
MKNSPEECCVRLLGVDIDSVTESDLLERIYALAHTDGKTIVAHTNVHSLNIAYHDKLFRSFFQMSTINFCDGAGVILGARLLSRRILERITYADFMWHLAAFSSKKEMSMYFVGSLPGVAEKAKQKLKDKYPSLKILGTQHGYFSKCLGHHENIEVVANINSAKPDLLIVGMGMPIQEHWVLENFERLDVKIILTGGAVFDYISGVAPRAPKWMTDHGLEWLGRMLIEPRRLWKRYLIGNPLFFWRIFIHHFLKVPLSK